MPHAFETDFGMSYFDTATVADNAAITYAFVFTAITFPVAHRPEYFFAEQTVSLRFERPVIDGFRLGNFSIGPVPDCIGRSQSDGNFAYFVCF
jgi:hypothetical protein